MERARLMARSLPNFARLTKFLIPNAKVCQEKTPRCSQHRANRRLRSEHQGAASSCFKVASLPGRQSHQVTSRPTLIQVVELFKVVVGGEDSAALEVASADEPGAFECARNIRHLEYDAVATVDLVRSLGPIVPKDHGRVGDSLANDAGPLAETEHHELTRRRDAVTLIESLLARQGKHNEPGPGRRGQAVGGEVWRLIRVKCLV